MAFAHPIKANPAVSRFRVDIVSRIKYVCIYLKTCMNLINDINSAMPLTLFAHHSRMAQP